ncbi:adhesion G protein-coupled receptor B1 isoform X1 [Camelus dromedarius]|uniref:adhesion G protein-coupled receptor B1 isoform X1 n=2 Tax=Camelus dromedarius TaxID=9838 RepID=UPI0031199503
MILGSRAGPSHPSNSFSVEQLVMGNHNPRDVAGGPENCLTSLTQDGAGMRSAAAGSPRLASRPRMLGATAAPWSPEALFLPASAQSSATWPEPSLALLAARPWHVKAWPTPACSARGTLAAPPARMRGQATALGALWVFHPLLLLLGRQPSVASETDVRPGVGRTPCWCRASSSGTSWVATEFSASASRCSWTLCNPNLPRYKLCMKVATVPACSSPACVGIYQLESFLESTPSYLGLEGCDEVLRLCDSSGPLAFLQAGKQFLQIKRHQLPLDDDTRPSHPSDNFSVEQLVMGNHNPRDVTGGPENCLTSLTQDGAGMRSGLIWNPEERVSF